MKLHVERIRAAELQIRVCIETAGNGILHRNSVLQPLVFVEEKVHVNRMNFGGAAFVHRTQVGVAPNLQFLDPLLVIERGIECVATHDVAFLLGGDATHECQLERFLLKNTVTRFDRHGTRSKRRL